eukprot:gene6082-12272_t
MVLGRECAERYSLTTSDLQEAQKILRNDFAFVGIAERWDESVRQFHGLYGGKLYSDELFAHYRRSPPALESVKRAIATTYDYFDEELYRTALEVFETQKLKLKDKNYQTKTVNGILMNAHPAINSVTYTLTVGSTIDAKHDIETKSCINHSVGTFRTKEPCTNYINNKASENVEARTSEQCAIEGISFNIFGIKTYIIDIVSSARVQGLFPPSSAPSNRCQPSKTHFPVQKITSKPCLTHSIAPDHLRVPKRKPPHERRVLYAQRLVRSLLERLRYIIHMKLNISQLSWASVDDYESHEVSNSLMSVNANVNASIPVLNTRMRNPTLNYPSMDVA